MLDWQILCTVY